MTKLLIGMVIVTYFARFNKSGKTTLCPYKPETPPTATVWFLMFLICVEVRVFETRGMMGTGS